MRCSHRFAASIHAELTLAALVVPALVSFLGATHPLPGPHYVNCRSEADVVRLEWDQMAFADGGSIAARLDRDGLTIARLSRSDLGFVDRGVPAGEHAYRIVLTEGAQVVDSNECRVTVGAGVPPPQDLQCSIQEKAPPCADLHWRNPAPYDSISVRRDGAEVAVLDGAAARFTEQPGPGLHAYEVRGVLRGELSAPATCEADFGGAPVHRLHLFSLPQAGAGPQDPPPPSDQLAVLLDNTYPVSAWSFGLCSDPAFTVPTAFNVGWVVAALNLGRGPSFLGIDILEGGLTMKAVVADAGGTDILPVGTGQRLLTLRYGSGPQAVPGDVYPLEFCDTLGDPPTAIALIVNGREVQPAAEPGVVLASAVQFLRGDSNADGAVNLSDGVFTLEWLFRGGRHPDCLDAVDVNLSREVDIADPIYTFSFLFLGGPNPPAPFPGCGTATSAVGCDRGGCPQGG